MPKCHPGLEGLTGIARVDPATHQLTHLEYTTPTQVGHTAPFGSTDYSPDRIGDKTLWLPAVTAASWAEDNAKVHLHTTIHYSDYHQYTATSTILPVTPQ
jgi:hypothetical protein